MARGVGTTTGQMLGAVHGAHYVWCNEQLEYPKELARKHGRPDLVIVHQGFFCGQAWQGIEFAGIILDHATELGEVSQRGYERAVSCIKPLRGKGCVTARNLRS